MKQERRQVSKVLLVGSSARMPMMLLQMQYKENYYALQVAKTLEEHEMETIELSFGDAL